MTPDRWQRAKEVFLAAVTRAPEVRAAFLDEACRGEASLRQDVESLLAADDEAGDFLSGGVGLETDSRAGCTRPSPVIKIVPGSKLGAYEILALIGAGGMGEVYRARDPRLNRDVAIKVLHADRMADENRRRRFVQEARSASALNHPNIVTIYEIESADGIDYIAMEYVPGKSLDALIPRQGMRLGEALKTAIPMADALARAHSRGIVHRDLKPANVMVSTEGVLKVLDFGLAKLVSSEEPSGEEETATRDSAASPLSHPGTIAGTAGYMSPEQATAGKVDSRSDVFAFGAVLYEMVTGRRAFAGNSTADTLAAVVRAQPKTPSELVKDVPRDLEKLILRCLRKDPEKRFHHMADVKVELEQIREDSDSQAASAPAVARRSRGLIVTLAVAATLALSAAAWRFWRPTGVAFPAPQVVPLTTTRGDEGSPTFSPGGDQVAFSWNGEKADNSDIYVKIVGSSETHRLTTDPAEDESPSWSPDGRQIAFVRTTERHWPCSYTSSCKGKLHLVSPLGGSDRKLSDFPVDAYGQLSWSPDGQWLAAARAGSASETTPDAGGIYLIALRGGEPRPIAREHAAGVYRDPAFSPDGRSLAYVSCGAGVVPLRCDVHVVELGLDLVPTTAPHRLTRQGLTIVGLAWARDGASIVYTAASGLSHLWRVGVRGDRPPERIDMAGHAAGAPAIAAAGQRLAFSTDLFDVDIYRFDARRPSELFLGSSFHEGAARFSPDGRRIAFESLRSGEQQEIWLAAADGSNPVQLTRGPGRHEGSPYWSPDGRQIAFDSQGEDGHWDIWTIDPEGGAPRRLTQDPGDENVPTWSQDGRWVYFVSARDGGPEIWRVPAPGGVEERVSHGGAGAQALESSDGKALYFTRHRGRTPLVVLPLTGGPERTLVHCVAGSGAFAVAAGSVYYTGCDEEPEMAVELLRRPTLLGHDLPLHRLDPATGQDRVLGTLEKSYTPITVSPDGKTILYAKVVSEGSDLMLIENFR